LSDDGWFRTGDLGVAEPDGRVTYQARIRDALRLAGFLTDPAEIEQQLATHPAVTGAQVVGAPTVSRGDVAVAFVTVGAPVEEAALIGHCRGSLANYKVPSRIVVVDAFPASEGPNGVKIRKAELRDRAQRLVTEAG
jgi:fatty-acyl-CoA synthase